MLEDMQRIGVLGYISQADRQTKTLTQQVAVALETVAGEDYYSLDAETRCLIRNRFSVYDLYCAADGCTVQDRVEWFPHDEGAWLCERHNHVQ